MQENTDTRKFENAPAGKYTFTVLGVPEKRRSGSGKTTFRIWKLKGISEEGQSFNNISLIMFPWDSRDLLLAVGGVKSVENEEIIAWDDEKVEGKQFTAELYYEKDKNDKDMARIKDVSESIPF